MKPLFLALAIAALVPAACDRTSDTAVQPSASPTTSATTPAPDPAATQPDKGHRPASAEEIAQIEASGKTGLWSEVTEVCREVDKPGISTTLMWNVKDKGVKNVVLYLVDKNGTERHFGRGGPVGRRATGPWLKPGLVFRLRGPDKQEVAAVTIGEKQC